jgi:pSer/pThr/pTyr-binding forkhead associated (FHA) protein
MRLFIQEPEKPPREVDAVVGLTIGRGPANTCVLLDDSASTAHARIIGVDGRLAIEDVGSSNGTRIEGASKLAKGDHFLLSPSLEIRIGRSLIRVLAPEPELGTQPRAADDAAGTRPRTAAPVETPTMRPEKRPEAELGTQPAARPSVASEDATLRPAARATPPSVAPPAPAAARPAPVAAPAAPPPRAPAPAPAPSSSSSARPVSQHSIPIPAVVPQPGDALGDLGVGGTMVVGGQATDAAAVQAMLAALAPRLVFVAHKQGRVEPVTERETKIGRRKGGPIAIGLDDEGVSANHALLSFSGNTFFLEDLESKNGTWVGDSKLAPRAGRLEVRCDKKVRFGTVDALFVRNPVQGEKPNPADAYAGALAALQKDASVPADKLREAAQQLAQRKHPGEFLIAANAIGVAQWCDAVEGARLGDVISAASGARGGAPKPMLWMLGGALLVAAAVIAWLLTR